MYNIFIFFVGFDITSAKLSRRLQTACGVILTKKDPFCTDYDC